MEMKKRIGISRKLLIIIVILSACICAGIIIAGLVRYNKSIRKVYNDMGYIVGDIILDYIDADQVEKYAETFEKDEYYQELVDYIETVWESSGAAYIYIMVPNSDGTMTYIYDCTGMDLGDSENMSSYVDELRGIYTSGERINNYLIRKSPKYGYLTSSVLPIVGSSGKVSALLCVDVYMAMIASTIRLYVIQAIITSIVLLIVFSASYMGYMSRRVINPIETMRKEAQDFIAHKDMEIKISGILDTIKTNDELQDLSESISQMEKDIVSYITNIRKVTAEKERIGAELDVATKIQADMLPTIFPPFPDREEFEIFASMDPAKEVGGDFYDFFMIDDKHLGLVIADVSGKGVPAALFMVISKTLIKSVALTGVSPKVVLETVNNQLCEHNAAEMFVTVWFGIMDITTGHVVSANAGHEYPALRGANSSYELIHDPHGFVLAGMDNLKYKEYEFDIEPGGALFLYTDGVAEATSEAKELYGTDRMLSALNSVTGLKIEDTLPTVRRDIDSFVGRAEQFDDITMMAIRYKGE